MNSLSQLLAKAAALFLVFIAPIKAIMTTAVVLVIADMLTGIWASVKEKNRITSHKLRRTFAKTIAYQVAILVSHLIETYMIGGVPIVKTIAGLIAITEGKSIFENLYRITGVNFWQVLIDKIQGSSIKLLPDDKEKK